MTAASPTTFGKYRILERIAVGGMAEIYKARLDGIGGFHRTFAIKRILPHLVSKSDFVDMLVDEAKVAGLLSHANIVQIMDLGQVEGTYYIAMEYVNGPDLGRVLRKCREKGITLPVPHAVFVTIEVLKGLEYAHNRQVMRGGRAVPLNIVHRDISPANVLVSFQGEVKITDFGIAKASVKALETVSGVIKGRFDYISPEQAAGKRADQRSDLFMTGVALYEMLTGRHPFKSDSEVETLEAIRDASHTPASEVNPDVPYQLELILEQALTADPAERFQSATAMKEALDRFFHDSGFIFSHSTLAAFLKGLFPEEARKSAGKKADRAVEALDQATRPISPEERLKPDEHPTNIGRRPELDGFPSHDTTLRAQAMPSPESVLQKSTEQLRLDRPDPGAPQAARDGYGAYDGYDGPDGPEAFGEERTLIKQAADVAAEAAAAGADPGAGDIDDPSAWGEARTVIKQSPLERPSENRGQPEKTHPQPVKKDPTRPDPARPEARRADAPPRREKAPARPGPSTSAAYRRAIRRTQLLYLAFGVVVTVVVLFVGFILGTRAAVFTAEPTASAPVKHQPELRVQVPEGADLYIDDSPLPGGAVRTAVLSAGETHTVRLEVEGARPVETTLTLQDNDVRVLSFERVLIEDGDAADGAGEAAGE